MKILCGFGCVLVFSLSYGSTERQVGLTWGQHEGILASLGWFSCYGRPHIVRFTTSARLIKVVELWVALPHFRGSRNRDRPGCRRSDLLAWNESSGTPTRIKNVRHVYRRFTQSKGIHRHRITHAAP